MMKTTMNRLAVVVVVAALALSSYQARAATITWTFLENGSNVALGPSSTFVEGGFALTAYGFADGAPATPSDLYAKFTMGNMDETGLGMATDVDGTHEIDTHHFVQVDSRITPPATIGALELHSIQVQEDAAVYGSNSLGDLGTWLTTLSADGSFNLAPFAGTYRYFGVTDVGTTPEADVLITALSATTAPDGGTTAMLLGLALAGIGLLTRRFKV